LISVAPGRPCAAVVAVWAMHEGLGQVSSSAANTNNPAEKLEAFKP
jgi:hypothetical protein